MAAYIFRQLGSQMKQSPEGTARYFFAALKTALIKKLQLSRKDSLRLAGSA